MCQTLSDWDGKRKGIYNHPIIQKAVNAMWFKNKRDEGIIYTDLFNPVSVHSIALILTAVSNSNNYFHFQVSHDKYNRLNAISTSGFLARRLKSPFGPTITASFMTAISCLSNHLATTRSPKVLTFLVGCNVGFITLDGESFIFLYENSFSFKNSLHAGVSTFEHGVRQAIPHSAFVDAVKDYQEDDSETDDEGSIHS